MEFLFVPGAWVTLPSRPDWGVGQVQSAVGTRITVNFAHAGKRLIDTEFARLDLAEPPPAGTADIDEPPSQ